MAVDPKEQMTVERLSESERIFHRRLFQQVQLGQATWQMWVAHLKDFYHLTPQDTITEDGFVRATPVTPQE